MVEQALILDDRVTSAKNTPLRYSSTRMHKQVMAGAAVNRNWRK